MQNSMLMVHHVHMGSLLLAVIRDRTTSRNLHVKLILMCQDSGLVAVNVRDKTAD